MKSHVINDLRKIPKTKLKSINSFCLDPNLNNTFQENPKKTFRISDTKGDEKILKLSDTINKDSDSIISGDRKRLLDSQPNNEIEVSGKRKKRSKRGKYRYNGNIVNSFALEIEQEQEEVALSLIMLSRDLGCRKRRFCSGSESSNNNFELVEVASSVKSTEIVRNKGKCSLSYSKFKKLRNGEVESTISGSESTRFDERKESGFGCKEKKLGDFQNEDEHICKSTEAQVRMRSIERKGKQDQVKISSQRNELDNKQRDLSKKLCSGNLEILMAKRDIFECTSCNKTFHSFQGLGGHRASHNKNKGCFAMRSGSREKSIDPGSFDSKTSCDSKKRKYKGHFECPVCFKVFSSGQALGGHKRSHFIDGADTKNNLTTVIKKQIPQVRDFLDLNLPAMTEEEEEESSGFKPWWIDRIVNADESFVGLLSN